ncbi:hypothetical protein TNCV_4977231 [Trichonephila clavipes]|nr:hypothetical protein TNCV_4977231 [Trichonephila clavipes]
MSERDGRNSSCQRARCAPVVNRRFEHHSGDSTFWLGITPNLREKTLSPLFPFHQPHERTCGSTAQRLSLFSHRPDSIGDRRREQASRGRIQLDRQELEQWILRVHCLITKWPQTESKGKGRQQLPTLEI